MSDGTKPEGNSDPVAPDRPAVEIELRDGSWAQVRPISVDDAALLLQGLDELSEQSRFARFGIGVARLSQAEVEYLTDVDQVTHVAWGALIDDQPAGAARYIVGPGADAEMAITVVDKFQRRGLGRVLFDALVASARAAGIEAFRFSIEPWNRSVPNMLSGVEFELDEEEGMLTGRVEVDLVPVTEHEADFARLIDEFRQS